MYADAKNRPSSPLIEWGVATTPATGESESGDQYYIEPFSNGVLVAVVDGLGHGAAAAIAAKTAVDALKGRAGQPMTALIKRCHEASRHTRGVVMSMASFDGRNNTMTWMGIGNVNGILLRRDHSTPAPGGRERLLSRGGVVGYQLPTPRPVTVTVAPNDTLVFATDGLRSAVVEDIAPEQIPQQMAEDALARHRRGTDDALVLVARYVGT